MMGKYADKSKVQVKGKPTCTIVVDKEARRLDVKIENWDGVSPGMLGGLEYAVQKAVHQWTVDNLTLARQQDAREVKAALDIQSGNGRVDSKTSEAIA